MDMLKFPKKSGLSIGTIQNAHFKYKHKALIIRQVLEFNNFLTKNCTTSDNIHIFT